MEEIMRHSKDSIRKYSFLIPAILGILILVGLIAFWPTSGVNAQCGSQASSCKNCHEVQGQDPVNNDGTGWHQSHAFGDFCYICHGGNQQSTDKDSAHTGMVSPLSDVKAGCQSCHPNDLMDRAQVYATALGVQLDSAGSGGGQESSPAVQPASADQSTTSGATSAVSSAGLTSSITEIAYDDPNLVNYAQRYEEIVLGKHPVNWGNVILSVMIGLVLVGGGGYVISNEHLVKISFGETTKVEGEYPTDVAGMLPEIARLKPKTRKSLKRILEHPKKADKVFDLIDSIITDEETEE
jgi:hypothetical protein